MESTSFEPSPSASPTNNDVGTSSNMNQTENDHESSSRRRRSSFFSSSRFSFRFPTMMRQQMEGTTATTTITTTTTQQQQEQQQRQMRRKSFIVQFAQSKGPPQITLLMMLVAIGLGSTIGVVPAVMSDRFARLNHGYTGDIPCADFTTTTKTSKGTTDLKVQSSDSATISTNNISIHFEDMQQTNNIDDKNSNNNDELIIKPRECYLGSADAQDAAATSSLGMNILTFLTSSLIGSLSDEHGRKPILIIGLFLSTMSPLMLFLMQIFPTMHPWWYYGAHVTSGLVNWIAVALSSLADVLPKKLRAPGLGLFLAGFMLGFSLAPIFAIFLNHIHLALTSFLVAFGGLFCTIFLIPETLPPHVAREAQRRRRILYEHSTTNRSQDNAPSSTQSVIQDWWQYIGRTIKWLVIRPIREISILNRNNFFRLISLLAFFSGMVSSGDQLLLVYYVEEQLGFTDKDVSMIFLIIGSLGLLAQGVVLKPLNECIGEKMVVACCFFIGAIDNTMYGIATNKGTIFAAVALSSFTGMAFPTISAIKSNNVDESEQGRIQGALYSLQALASGIGPVLLRYVYSRAKDGPLGAGVMFVFAGGLYLVAVAAACALPKELANSPRDTDEDDISEHMSNEDYIPLFESVRTESSDQGSNESHTSYGAM